MPGEEGQKFANLRLLYTYLYTHPGKKLMFMGGEFAQRAEWNHDRSLDWHLLEHGSHRGVQRLVADLNRLYREKAALHQTDLEDRGFSWVDCQGLGGQRSQLSETRGGRCRIALGGPELHAGCARGLSPRRATTWRVEGTAKQRLGVLRRVQHRQSRTSGRRAGAISRPRILSSTHAAAPCRCRLRASRRLAGGQGRPA